MGARGRHTTTHPLASGWVCDRVGVCVSTLPRFHLQPGGVEWYGEALRAGCGGGGNTVARTRTQTRRQTTAGQPLDEAAGGETRAAVAPRATPTLGAAPMPGSTSAAPRVRIERIIQHQLDNAAPHLLLAQAPSVLPPKTHDLFASYIAATAARADWCGGFAEPEGS